MRWTGERWAGVAVSAAAPAMLSTAVTPVSAAPTEAAAAARNYQAWICVKDGYGKTFTKANVGGRNQHGTYVHTPNFRPVP
ncbi:hypothetical protein [Streptomyces rimosus]|uniref:hypothetical protein n=1 Tax=Streptomyces rimosus TaxID=1927 RepID=UPI000AE55F8E|nr:hypothetical protein [Streptomyces rimosus]